MSTTTPTVDDLIRAIAAGDPGHIPALRGAPGARTFQDAQGRTLLHLAAIQGQPDAVYEMLLLCIDPSTQDHDGKTALDLANGAARDVLAWAPGHAYPHFVRLRAAIEADDEAALIAARDGWHRQIEETLCEDESVFESFHHALPARMAWDGERLEQTAARLDGNVRYTASDLLNSMEADGDLNENDDDE
jgi:hypothetical protein